MRNRIWRAVLSVTVATTALAALPPAPVSAQSAVAAPEPRESPYRVGFITYARDGLGDQVKTELAKLGYIEGANIEFRRFNGNRNLAVMPQLARDLVAWKPDVIISLMTNAHVAVQEATRENQIPVVLWASDPLQAGVIESFRKPGTNFTGFAYEPYQAMHHLRLLKSVHPGLKCVGHLYNHTYSPAPASLRDLRSAAAMMNVEVIVGEALTRDEIEPRIADFRAAGCDGFTVGPHELFNGNGALIGALAAKHRLASVSLQVSIVQGGGLAAYAPPHDRGWPIMAAMVDRILRGEKPADIPIERRLGSPLILNLKSAQGLGLTVPASLIDEADRIIE